MNIAKTYSAQLVGLHSQPVIIEVDISHGLHAFSIVGLGDRSVDEAKDRISAAIKNSGYTSPKQKNQKVVISLAPAHVRKEGSAFDVAMALAYLQASGDIDFESERSLFLGELSLDGHIRKINGVVPIACQAARQGFTALFVPQENIAEAVLARDITVYGISSLREIISHLQRQTHLTPARLDIHETPPPPTTEHDIAHIRGNETAKRGLEIAAAGGHNSILYGPPGTGKTMLARSFHSLLPDLSYEHSIEVTSIHSAAHMPIHGLARRPPLRSPHHTASYASIVGGGNTPRPGEITLAHRGVLFMDEFPEFDHHVIEAMRQPLEDREITISRAHSSVTFPAQCILIGSMNPCPCGLGRDAGCTCPEHIIRNYRRRLSQPIMDRIDIWIPVTKIDYARLSSITHVSETSAAIRERVHEARRRQAQRCAAHGISRSCNSELGARDLDVCINMSDRARSTLRSSAERLGLSGRAFHRIIKVAQTITDLCGREHIDSDDILEAIQYRSSLYDL